MSKNRLTMIMETNKFNVMNYNDWLRNLRTVLDFENQGYVLDKSFPTALPEGSSPEECVMFEKWLKENHKVYAVPDRHIRYATTKQFFGTKTAKGSSMHSHGIKMLSLIEKLEDLKAGFYNDRYIDVILQSLPPSYDPFFINYNMNGLSSP
ncbi:UNVERIFIED_CONTAM: hypothetical protein Sangu_2526600 [Sesamum angustifolium]|uniref:Uncharacterized protein n=1 Tax=Sesamum angustifolium TaxID=2727405 RepID=A0AAW2JEG0_9LAMI